MTKHRHDVLFASSTYEFAVDAMITEYFVWICKSLTSGFVKRVYEHITKTECDDALHHHGVLLAPETYGLAVCVEGHGVLLASEASGFGEDFDVLHASKTDDLAVDDKNHDEIDC